MKWGEMQVSEQYFCYHSANVYHCGQEHRNNLVSFEKRKLHLITNNDDF